MPIRPTRRRLLFATLLLAGAVAEAASLTAQLAAESALLGLQLAARQRAAKGALPAAQNACLQALQPREFFETTEKIVTEALTPAELAEAERFLGSEPGRKYGRHGLLSVYAALGEKPPEALPEFTVADGQAIEAFAATPAGRALLGRQVLQSPAAQEAYGRRSQALVAGCQAAGTPAP